MGVLKRQIEQARASGDYTAVAETSKRLQEAGTAEGQFLQAFSKYSRTPEGALLRAQQTVAAAERAATESKDSATQATARNAKGRQLDADIQAATKAVHESEQQAAEALSRELSSLRGQVDTAHSSINNIYAAMKPEQAPQVPVSQWSKETGNLLAKRLEARVTDAKARQKSMIDTILGDLVKFADEHALPSRKTSQAKRSAVDTLTDFFNNRDFYAQAWTQAQQQIRTRYKDNPEVLTAFDEWLNGSIAYSGGAIHTQTVVLDAITSYLMATDGNLQTLIDYSAFGLLKSKTDSVADYLIAQTGATGADAQQLRDAVSRNLSDITFKKAPDLEKRLGNIISRAASDLQIHLSKIAEQSAAGRQAVGQQIVDLLVSKYSLSAAESQIASDTIMERYNELVAQRAKKKLETILKGKNAPKRKSYMQRVERLMNLGAFDSASIAAAIKEKYGIPALDADDVKQIYEYSALAQQQTDDYQRRRYEAMAQDVVTDKLPTSLREKIKGVRRLSMLLNPKTLLSRNAGGNVVAGGLESLKDIPGTAIDAIVAQKTGIRTTQFSPLSGTVAQLKGAKKGLTEWAKDIKYGVDTSETAHEMPRGNTFESKPMQVLDEVLNKLLQLGDRPFYEAAYAGRMNELQRLGYDVAQDDIQADAKLYALERVFQNDSDLARRAMEMRRSLGILGDITVPFAQTPSNILDKLLDYSPVGLARSVKLAGTIGDSAWSQKRFVDTLGRALTGTGMLALFFAMAARGLLRGGGDDKNQVYAMEKQAGLQPYSIVVGDKTYTYDSLTVAGALMAAAADTYALSNGDSSILQLAMSGMATIGTVFFQQSYLDGISELFGYGDFIQGLGQVISGLPASFVATLSSQAAKVIDPIQRETYDPNPVRQSLNKAVAKVPFASMLLPAKVGLGGEDAPQFQGRETAFNIFESFFSPGYIGEDVRTEAQKEQTRLYEATGNTAVLPPSMQKSAGLDLDGDGTNDKTITFSAQEYRDFNATYRGAGATLGSDIMSDAAYNTLNDAEKATAVIMAYEYALEQAKMEIEPGYTPSIGWVKTAMEFDPDTRAELVMFEAMRRSAGDTSLAKAQSVQGADLSDAVLLSDLTENQLAGYNQYAKGVVDADTFLLTLGYGSTKIKEKDENGQEQQRSRTVDEKLLYIDGLNLTREQKRALAQAVDIARSTAFKKWPKYKD